MYSETDVAPPAVYMYMLTGKWSLCRSLFVEAQNVVTLPLCLFLPPWPCLFDQPVCLVQS